MIRPIEEKDYAACLSVYNHYIENTTYSFETEPLTLAAFSERADRIRKSYPYLVWEDEKTGTVCGYCYLDRYSPRAGYRFTCDVSVYLAPDCTGHGIGRQLYDAIHKEALSRGFYQIFAIVTSENHGSAAFHKSMGYTEEAHFEKIAYKMGKWLGVYYFRKILREPEPGIIPAEPAFEN